MKTKLKPLSLSPHHDETLFCARRHGDKTCLSHTPNCKSNAAHHLICTPPFVAHRQRYIGIIASGLQ